MTDVEWIEIEKAGKNRYSSGGTEELYGLTLSLYTGLDRKSTRLNSSHSGESRMPSSA